MSLFGKRSGMLGCLFGGIIGGLVVDLFNDGPNIIEKAEMFFTDVEIEGKKQGYNRASKEYGKVYSAIETEFLETKKLIEKQKNSYDNKADILINKLEALEIEKAKLEQHVHSKTQDVSCKFNIPIGDVKSSIVSGVFPAGGAMISVDVLGLIYKYKEKKLIEAEQRGYAEAREIYENKISKLKAELRRLKENGNKDIKKLVTMIEQIFEAIADEQMKIADLRILL